MKNTKIFSHYLIIITSKLKILSRKLPYIHELHLQNCALGYVSFCRTNVTDNKKNPAGKFYSVQQFAKCNGPIGITLTKTAAPYDSGVPFFLIFKTFLLRYATQGLRFNNCTLRPHCIYVFCIYLTTNSDLVVK